MGGRSLSGRVGGEESRASPDCGETPEKLCLFFRWAFAVVSDSVKAGLGNATCGERGVRVL